MSESRIRYRMGLLLALLALSLLSHAQATLSIGKFSITQGETKEVFIKLDNTVEIRALQARIVLPDSLSMASRPQLVSGRLGGSTDEFGEWMPSTKSLSYNRWDDGSHMIMVNSDDGMPFFGTEGAVISLSIKAAEGIAPGEYVIGMEDVELVYSDGESYIRQDDCEWIVTVVTRRWQLTYLVDEEVYRTDSIVPGSIIVPAENPVKEGYTFGGWTELPETMPKHDVTVTGTFTVNKYKVTYTVDGEVLHIDSIIYGTALTALAEPIKEGYTFSGWSEIPDTMPAENVTVTGTFSINTYKLTYTVDGEVYQTDSIIYGTALTIIAEPAKEGCTFSGWSEIPETMPAEDVMITGTFSINTYKLTYTVDGGVYHTDSVTFAEAVIPIVEPEKEGYTFSGWTGVPETMPAKDVTVTGKFILNRTQTDAQGLVYELNQEGDAFEVSNYTSALVSDLVVPSDIYGVPVTTLRDRAFMGSIGLKSIVLPESVVFVGDRAFYACYDLLFVEWNAEAPIAATCFDKPDQYGNMLVYVSDASVPIAYDGNVVVNGVAEKITLTAGLPLRNTREFTARRINYTHEFTKQTRIGESGGWEALVLPFDVQVVTNEEKGALLPFGKADFTASLPYWLAELQSDGTFAYVDAIKANTPFIMEVPNSEEYEEMYNIKGNVTFSAENVVVHATTSMPEPSGSNYVLVGCYEGMESGSRVYALNDEEYTVDGIEYMPGGVFVSGDRDIRPFEAYVYSNSAARAPYLRISGRDGTGLVPAVIGTTDDGWYTLQGIRLNGKPTERGVYIINRKKVIID